MKKDPSPKAEPEKVVHVGFGPKERRKLEPSEIEVRRKYTEEDKKIKSYLDNYTDSCNNKFIPLIESAIEVSRDLRKKKSLKLQIQTEVIYRDSQENIKLPKEIDDTRESLLRKLLNILEIAKQWREIFWMSVERLKRREKEVGELSVKSQELLGEISSHLKNLEMISEEEFLDTAEDQFLEKLEKFKRASRELFNLYITR